MIAPIFDVDDGAVIALDIKFPVAEVVNTVVGNCAVGIV